MVEEKRLKIKGDNPVVVNGRKSEKIEFLKRERERESVVFLMYLHIFSFFEVSQLK